MLTAMGIQVRVPVFLQEKFLRSKVADCVLDNFFQNFTHYGVCTARTDRVVQFGHRAEELSVLMIELSDMYAEALIPPESIVCGRLFAIEHARTLLCTVEGATTEIEPMKTVAKYGQKVLSGTFYASRLRLGNIAEMKAEFL